MARTPEGHPVYDEDGYDAEPLLAARANRSGSHTTTEYACGTFSHFALCFTPSGVSELSWPSLCKAVLCLRHLVETASCHCMKERAVANSYLV